MKLFFSATTDEERLKIIKRYYWLPHHCEIYILYCYLNAPADSDNEYHARRITLQAIENISAPALQDIRPSDDEYIYALTHHLSDTSVTDFHTIMNDPNIPSNSCLTPRSWDNTNVLTTKGDLTITAWALQCFKTRLTHQEHTLNCIDHTIYGPDHKRLRFLNLHP